MHGLAAVAPNTGDSSVVQLLLMTAGTGGRRRDPVVMSLIGVSMASGAGHLSGVPRSSCTMALTAGANLRLSLVLRSFVAGLAGTACCRFGLIGVAGSAVRVAGGGGISVVEGFCAVVASGAGHLSGVPRSSCTMACFAGGPRGSRAACVALRAVLAGGESIRRMTLGARLRHLGIVWMLGRTVAGCAVLLSVLLVGVAVGAVSGEILLLAVVVGRDRASMAGGRGAGGGGRQVGRYRVTKLAGRVSGFRLGLPRFVTGPTRAVGRLFVGVATGAALVCQVGVQSLLFMASAA